LTLAIVDAGPLVAAVDSDAPRHREVLDVLEDLELRLVVPALVVAEATYLVGTRLGPRVEARFLRAMEQTDVEGPAPEDFVRMAELVEEYADFRLGGTDASVIALAERLDASVIVTLDRRRFGAVRPRHRPAFELLP
jgi:predicted nucleic acid-binding protein